MYHAVIFDVDGTLVDSNDAHAWAWIQALAESGRHVDFAPVRPHDISPFKRPCPCVPHNG